ncbi:hypothetical protein CEXT_436481 [Caerostris extrusa]|uniref:Uncharacterized protein n=1 Tax=Caerostris extrusa TaxID=172846 RepID=A0AAV4M604_CAEEX|nr:hypothetical protein CEXT_436481 [Caerostris extrusa]
MGDLSPSNPNVIAPTPLLQEGHALLRLHRFCGLFLNPIQIDVDISREQNSEMDLHQLEWNWTSFYSYVNVFVSHLLINDRLLLMKDGSKLKSIINHVPCHPADALQEGQHEHLHKRGHMFFPRSDFTVHLLVDFPITVISRCVFFMCE